MFKKILGILVVLSLIWALPSFAATKIYQDGVDENNVVQDLDFARANISKSGLIGLIDDGTMTQRSTTGEEPVVTLDQNDVDYAFLKLDGESGNTNHLVVSGTRTESPETKYGAFKVQIVNSGGDGSTIEKWIRLWNCPGPPGATC